MFCCLGANDFGTWRLHSTFGIILSLCNGKRTVSEIARIVVPFTGISDELEAYSASLATVKDFVRWMTFSKEEQTILSKKDLGDQQTDIPQKHEESPLVERSVFDRTFTGFRPYESLEKDAREKNWASRSKCTAGRSGMMICADGKVIPCEQMPETEKYFCGDVSYLSIMEVWNGKRLKEMTYGMPREKFRGQPCYDCEEREECLDVMGTCIRDLAAHYGNIYQPPPNCYRHDMPFVRQT